MFSRLLCSVGCTICYAHNPKKLAHNWPTGHFLFAYLSVFQWYQAYYHHTIMWVCRKWDIPRVPPIPIKMFIIILIWGFLNMGDPQITMGSICFNTKSWSSMTWMIWGTPATWGLQKLQYVLGPRCGGDGTVGWVLGPLVAAIHLPNFREDSWDIVGWSLNFTAFSWVSCKDLGHEEVLGQWLICWEDNFLEFLEFPNF